MKGPFDDHLFRCSCLGKITGKHKRAITDKQLDELAKLSTRPKRTAKQEEKMHALIAKKNAPLELPDTCTTYLQEVYNDVIYNFKEEVGSKYFEKGNWKEEDSITLLQQTIFKNSSLPLVKNKERKNNQFVIGTHDVKYFNIIIDNKNAWSWKTLQNAELTNDYEWQGRGYMWLNNCDKFILFYSLLNLPDVMMRDEERKMFYRVGYLGDQDPKFLEDCEKLNEMFNFEKRPPEERFRVFTVERDIQKELELQARIMECRIWLNKFHAEQLAIAEANKLFTA